MTSRDFRDRLLKRARKADVTLPDALAAELEAYFRLLARWSEKINLTALPLQPPSDEALDRLLIEPLAAARFFPDTPLRWLDIGSGGGSPAIPLKLARPAARLTMLESKTRKAAFLREAARALRLAEADVANVRFEELAASGQGVAVDIITARAIRVDRRFLDAVDRLLTPAGSLMLFSANAPKMPGRLELAQVARLTASSQLTILRKIA